MFHTINAILYNSPVLILEYNFILKAKVAA